MNGILGSPTGLGVFAGRQGLGATYPFGKYSDDTKALQRQVNAWLAATGLAVVAEDGLLGQRTCGALRKAKMEVPSTCSGFVEPTPGYYPWNNYSADTKALQAVLAARFPSVKVDGILGPLTCGAGKAAGRYPATCESFTLPEGAVVSAGPSVAPAPAAAPGKAVDWVALAAYAAAVKAQNDKRAADLLAYAAAVKADKDRQNLLAYAAAVKAANDKKAADLLAYVAAVKAAQAAKKPAPRPPAARAVTVAKPKVSAATPVPPPPAPPPPAPDPALEPAHASAEIAEAGMSMTTKLALGVGVVAVVGYMVFFRKPSPKAA